MTRAVLLGPQAKRPTVAPALEEVAPSGPIAAITAGWQERESEDDELRAHVARDVVNLRLWERCERIFATDPEIFAAVRARQDELQALQGLYRLRLGRALQAARELMAREPGGRFLEEHRSAAIRAVRTIDRQHLRRLIRLHDEFEETWKPGLRPAIARERAQIADEISRCSAIAVAGGHVAVLLNRLRFLPVLEAAGPRPVIAWSAGAMALSRTVVLFHDSPPQGAGNPELLDAGLGWFGGVIALPHARERLRLEDRVRVSLFAQRFAPDTCVVFEPGSRVDYDEGKWTGASGAVVLGRRGRLREFVTH